MSSEHDYFFAKWDEWYPKCPPVPHLMMKDYAHRWCAIYDHPNRDNPNRTPEDKRIVLQRHAAVTAEVLGVGNPCAVVLTLYDTPPPGSWVESFHATNTDHWLKQWSGHPVYPAELQLGQKALAICAWPPASFEDMVLDVSNECLSADVFFVALDSGRAYAPGVGGAGLFVEDMPTAHALWDKYWALGWTPPDLYSPKRACDGGARRE